MARKLVFQHIREEPRAVYPYFECGLDYVYINSGYLFYDFNNMDHGVSVADRKQLQQAIGRAVSRRDMWITPVEFQWLRDDLRLEPDQLAHILGCETTHIQNWEDESVRLPAQYAHWMCNVWWELTAFRPHQAYKLVTEEYE